MFVYILKKKIFIRIQLIGQKYEDDVLKSKKIIILNVEINDYTL